MNFFFSIFINTHLQKIHHYLFYLIVYQLVFFLNLLKFQNCFITNFNDSSTFFITFYFLVSYISFSYSYCILYFVIPIFYFNVTSF
nr:hypothetical protein CoNPh37_CDS0154 [Staphylococcus phage S-CoN_Ph37]